MRLFDCEVRHSGNILHSIPRTNVTEKEVELIAHLHGKDAIINLRSRGVVEGGRPEMEEYARLATTYGKDKVEECFHVKLSDFAGFLDSAVQAESPSIAQMMAAATAVNQEQAPAGSAPVGGAPADTGGRSLE